MTSDTALHLHCYNSEVVVLLACMYYLQGK